MKVGVTVGVVVGVGVWVPMKLEEQKFSRMATVPTWMLGAG